jgi:hypothetical protein
MEPLSYTTFYFLLSKLKFTNLYYFKQYSSSFHFLNNVGENMLRTVFHFLSFLYFYS